jgi:hypothetical protein
VPLLAADHIIDLVGANHLLDQLVPHANQHEIHRELRMKPQQAWKLAQKEKRSVRPVPCCPWWPFVWSVRTSIKVAPEGRVPIGSQLLRVVAAPGSKLILCHHPSGHYSVLADKPDQKNKPVIFFSNLPK